jgi:thiamine biosynthesis lipoprotein
MNVHKRIGIEIALGLALIVGLYLGLRTREVNIWPADRIEIDGGYHEVMGTFGRAVAVVMNEEAGKKCVEAALQQLQKVDTLMSDYKGDSEISRVNKEAFSRAVQVSSETFEVFEKSIELSRLSDGAFDVTVGPLVDLWKQAGETGDVPGESELAQAKSRVGYEKLILDSNEMSIRFSVEGMRVDFGGIAKGYAIDKAIEAMQKLGAIGGMVDVGGDIRCFGASPPGKNYWRIGVEDPRETKAWLGQGEPVLIVELTNGAVTTSGDYRRYVMIDGKRYSHIIDSQAGSSSEKLASVTIISANAINADGLATAVSVMGAEKGLALIEEVRATETILITLKPKYEIIQSSGAERYLAK